MRKIIHIDMDCFYAAVELRDNPQLRGKPVAIGGLSDRRGVICTADYVARDYGVKAAMPTIKALSLCPHLELILPNMEKYKRASKTIHAIFSQYTDMIEPLSLDEAYLDVSDCLKCKGSATWLAEHIRADIEREVNLTASAGIAPNKLLAKIASDWRKPNGQFVIYPAMVEGFMPSLPVKLLPGVGPVLQHKLHSNGIVNCGELQRLSLNFLVTTFGKVGATLYQYCRGIDFRLVESTRQTKSISVEQTYERDITTQVDAENCLPLLFEQLVKRWQQSCRPAIEKVFVKIKCHDFQTTTIERAALGLALMQYKALFATAYTRFNSPIRLIGLGLRIAPFAQFTQLPLPFKEYMRDE